MDETKTRELIHAYLACASFVDAQIDKVTRTLEELGLIENTIIVIWSDHGYKIGEYGDWSKHTNFELDTKVPLIFYWKDRLPPQTNQSVAELLHIYPTLTDLASLPRPKGVQGISLAGLIKEQGLDIDHVALSQFPRGKYIGYSIRDQQYRYTAWVDEETKSVDFEELYDHEDQGMVAEQNLVALKELNSTREKLQKRLFEEFGLAHKNY